MKRSLSPEHEELQRRLKNIGAVFDLSKLTARKAGDTGMIATYYRRNRLTYKHQHSKEGFVHMGISRDGVFKTDDFYEQARMIQEYIDQLHPSEVLELAAGKAATTRYLARRNPKIHFQGVDLPDGQLDANAKRSANLSLVYGDYHDLGFIPDNSQDIVYIIEALCHSHDRKRVMKEVARVLKPGGCFIVFDGYTTKARSAMTDLERQASDITFKSMMVDTDDLYYGNFKKDLAAAGLALEEEEDLSQYVLPNMRRLEASSAKVLSNRYVAKVLTYIFSSIITANAVAGYLMRPTVEMSIHQYWFTVARKH